MLHLYNFYEEESGGVCSFIFTVLYKLHLGCEGCALDWCCRVRGRGNPAHARCTRRGGDHV